MQQHPWGKPCPRKVSVCPKRPYDVPAIRAIGGLGIAVSISQMRRTLIKATLAIVLAATCAACGTTHVVTRTVSSPASSTRVANRSPTTPSTSPTTSSKSPMTAKKSCKPTETTSTSSEAPSEVNGVSYNCATATQPYCTQGECIYPSKSTCAAGYTELDGTECTRPAVVGSPPPTNTAATSTVAAACPSGEVSGAGAARGSCVKCDNVALSEGLCGTSQQQAAAKQALNSPPLEDQCIPLPGWDSNSQHAGCRTGEITRSQAVIDQGCVLTDSPGLLNEYPEGLFNPNIWSGPGNPCSASVQAYGLPCETVLNPNESNAAQAYDPGEWTPACYLQIPIAVQQCGGILNVETQVNDLGTSATYVCRNSGGG
jgi:hypothetical protein